MRTLFQKLAAAALCALLLAALWLPCAAADTAEAPAPYDVSGRTIDEIVADFMAEFHLTEKNFSMGWYDTGSGESWYFNEHKYIAAGSMYKLPLAMSYYLKFADGSFAPEDKTGGYTLDQLLERAIVYSDNDAAALLRDYYSPSYETYRYALAQFSDVAQDDLPYDFLVNNCISPHIMLDALKALYADRALYAGILADMQLAQPERYFRKYQRAYDIAHKYGYFEGCLNDCGVVYTPTPFLLVAFTDHAAQAETALATLAQRLTDYALRLQREAEQRAAAQAAAAKAEAEAAAEAEQAAAEAAQADAAAQAQAKAAEAAAAAEAARQAEQAAAETAPRRHTARETLLVVAGAAALLAVCALLLLRPRRKRKPAPQHLK